MDIMFEYERISVEDAVKAITPVAWRGRIKDWGNTRTRAPEAPLAEATGLWLASLPAELVPRQLARDFPRIANKLCALWKRPSRCDVYFNELILVDREHRAGFPPAVMGELGTLAAHYAELYPTRRSVWSTVHKR
jgi:hypothetical protein